MLKWITERLNPCTFAGMRQPTNKITLGLIISSIILLLILQAFWLRSVYFDQLQSLQREAHILFRNSLFEMNDSLMKKNIKALPTGESKHTMTIPPSLGDVIYSGKRTVNDSFRVITQSRDVTRFGDTIAN